MSDTEKKPRFVTDTHSHTIASGHAYNTLEEMAKAAADRGLLALAVTDHGPKMPGSCDAMYFRNFKIIDRFQYGIELLMGCELNIMDYDGTLDLQEKDFRQLDITIASIHTICYTVGSKAENMRAYQKAMEIPWWISSVIPTTAGFPWIMRSWSDVRGIRASFWSVTIRPWTRKTPARTGMRT